MLFRPRSEIEIHQIAEAVILGRAQLADYSDLSGDDRARIERIVSRGPEGLVSLNRRAQLHQRQLRTKSYRSPTGTSLIAVAPPVDVGTVLSGLKVPVFDVDKLGTAKYPFAQAISRALTTQELAVYASTLSVGQLRQLEVNWEPAAGVGESDKRAVMGKVAWAAVEVLEQAKSESDYLATYRRDLSKLLEDHCKALFMSLGIAANLERLSEREARILAGLTPRDDLAKVASVCDPEQIRRVTQHLPVLQQQEVHKEQRLFISRREQDLRGYLSVIEALKRWSVTIEKVKPSQLSA